MLRKAATNSGEYAGSCPWCGGQDRFLVWPDEGQTGRYWCRQCERHGDGIQYLRDWHGKTFREACRFLGVMPKPQQNTRTGPSWEPKAAISPPEVWMEKAAVFIKRAQENLWKTDSDTRRWLMSKRGLTEETIERAGLGFCPISCFQEKSDWGLERNGKKLWFPSGIVIPSRTVDRITRIRIRKNNTAKSSQYYLLPGSNIAPMVLPGNPGTILILESDLDAWLVHQEAGDLVTVMALGSANIRPDLTAHQLLARTDRIFLSLDNDTAGIRSASGWWKKQCFYPWDRLPPILGKDPGAMFQAGVPIRDWVKAGLKPAQSIG